MSNHGETMRQSDIDESLLALIDTIQTIASGLATYSGETERELYERIVNARKRVYEVSQEVSKLFVETLEKCSQQSPIKPSITWVQDEYGNLRLDGNRKLGAPCLICGEKRVSEYCHIIPKQIGGSNRSTNIIYLCPTHHSCFDKGVLTKAEFDALDLRGKSDLAKSYVKEVLGPRQERHWRSEFVPTNMAYHSFEPLTTWIKTATGCESVDHWNRKRKNRLVVRSGRHQLG